MASRNYTRLPSWQAFARQLVQTQDLDPIYTMLWKCFCQPSNDEDVRSRQFVLQRWLLAYWCFYSADTATRIAVAGDYWQAMREAAADKSTRGFERRHFRGEKAVRAVERIHDLCLVELGGRNSSPAGAGPVFEHLYRGGTTFEHVSARAQDLPLFGPWIGWKVCDMLERLDIQYVDFSHSTLNVYRDPRAGAAIIRFGDEHHPITDSELGEVVSEICHELNSQGYKAPPRWDRPINIQEAETILCKWKAHLHGHYPLGNDTAAIYHVLGNVMNYELGRELFECLPRI